MAEVHLTDEDRQLLSNVVRTGQLGREAVPDDLRAADTPKKEGAGPRLLEFERDLQRKLEDHFKESAPANGDEILEMVQRVFRTQVGIDPQRFLNDDEVFKSLQNRLKLRVNELLALVTEDGVSPVHIRAAILLMCTEYDTAFEVSLRSKAGQGDLEVTAPDRGYLDSSGKNVLQFRSAVRTFLYAASMATTFEGIRDFALMHSNYDGFLLNAGAAVTGFSLAEFMLIVKRQVEHHGLVRGLGLGQAITSFLRTNPLIFITALGLAVPDVYTNVRGALKYAFSWQDSTTQIDAVKGQLLKSRADVSAKLQDANTDSGVSSIDAKVTAAAVQALVSESQGTYSGEPGFGPRFYALEDVYFPNTAMDFYTSPKDPRCEKAMTIPAEFPSASYSLARLEDGSWCVSLQAPVAGKQGWIIGPAAGANAYSAGRILQEKAKAEGPRGLYALALDQSTAFLAAHPQGYAVEIKEDWKRYLEGVHATADGHFDKAESIADGWRGTDTVKTPRVEWDTQVKPVLAELKTSIVEEKAKAQKALADTSGAYTTFDGELIQALSESGKPVTIPTPKFSFLDFDLPEPDLTNGFVERNAWEQVGAVNEKEGSTITHLETLVVALFGTVVSYLDFFGFYYAIRKHYSKDQEAIEKAMSDLKRYVHRLLEALNTHLNRGPFKALYGDGVTPIPESILRERVQAALSVGVEEAQSVAVEEDLLIALFKKLQHFVARVPSGSTVGSECREAFEDARSPQSAVIRSYNRLVRAVKQFGDPSVDFETTVMAVNGFTPQQVISTLVTQGTRDPERLSELFRVEFSRGIRGSAGETRQEAAVDRYARLEKCANDLRTRLNIFDDAWLLDYAAYLEETEGETQQGQLFAHLQTAQQSFITSHQALLRAYIQAGTGFKTAMDRVEQAAKQADQAEIDRLETASLTPTFSRIETALKVLPYPRHQVPLSHERAKQLLEDATSQLDSLRTELQGLTPQATALRERCQALLKRIQTKSDEVARKTARFEQDTLPDIYAARLDKTRDWVNENKLPISDSEAARRVLTSFADLVETLYDGVQPAIVLKTQATQGKPVQLISGGMVQAYARLATDLRNFDDNTFALDQGRASVFDFAPTVGEILTAAYQKLGVSVQIQVPEKLARLQITTTPTKP